MSTAEHFETALVWSCPGAFGSSMAFVSMFEKGGIRRPHGFGAQQCMRPLGST